MNDGSEPDRLECRPCVMPTEPPTVCPACRLPPRNTFRLVNGARLLRCPRCLLGWWRWPAFEPAEFYDRDYFQSARDEKGYDDYDSLTAGLESTARARLRRIGRLLAETESANRTAPPRIHDIGCGTGIFLGVASAGGWQATGAETSPYAAQVARAAGLDVNCADAELSLWHGLSASDSSPHDAVTLWDVIEHLRDPAAVLQRAAATLRPGGVLALSTGDISSLCARLCGPRWHLFNLPEHLFFFTPRCLQILLARAGCRVVRIVREPYWAPGSYLFERLGKAFGMTTARPRDRLSSWCIPANLFDVLGVYAVRMT